MKKVKYTFVWILIFASILCQIENLAIFFNKGAFPNNLNIMSLLLALLALGIESIKNTGHTKEKKGEEKMKAEIKEDMYLVLKNDDIIWYLKTEEIKDLDAVIKKIKAGREKDGKKTNSYYVCNKDEPYAQKVIDAIIEGETEKLGQRKEEKKS